jgi:site-specific DNA-methyltransferase (adenine-specific)
MLEVNQIYHGDCLEVMKDIDDKSIDLVLTDPPYGIGLDVWDIKVDIEKFTKQVNRVLTEEGFYVFFGQMPTIIEWINQANQLLKFKDHISWVKRTITPSKRLNRGHEEIMIYSKNGTKFYNTKGKYEDVKVTGISFDTATIEAVKRYISSLHATINGSKKEIVRPGKSNSLYKRYHLPSFRAPEYVNYTNVWSFLPQNNKNRNKTEFGHPTTKPLLLVKRLVEMLTLENMIVLDPFIGSGTTAIACQELNRKFIGMELSKEYYDMAQKRVNQTPKPLLV